MAPTANGVSLGVRIRVSFREDPSLVLSGEETKYLGVKRSVEGRCWDETKQLKL